ncbi:MAG TPA: M67 family metallopeptidase [Puia sp.]|nr:M67 family metallopeptidase [Puia sp.]
MIIIEPRVRQLMIEDAINTFPDECCGFLFGREEHDGTRVLVDILAVDNSKEGDKRRRFAISPQDYMTAEQHALDHDWTLLGIYHSHPNHPAIPSEHDRVAAQPFFSYVIVSVLEKEVITLRSWVLNDDQQFEEEKIIDYQFS